MLKLNSASLFIVQHVLYWAPDSSLSCVNVVIYTHFYSLCVSQSHAFKKFSSDFLLMFSSNYGSVLHHFKTYLIWKIL